LSDFFTDEVDPETYEPKRNRITSIISK